MTEKTQPYEKLHLEIDLLFLFQTSAEGNRIHGAFISPGAGGIDSASERER
jgi:hypothetical protein